MCACVWGGRGKLCLCLCVYLCKWCELAHSFLDRKNCAIQEPSTIIIFHFSTLPSQQHSPMPEMAVGSMAEGGAQELPQRPGEDCGLCLGKWASDLDSMPKELRTSMKVKCVDAVQ